MIFNKYFNYSSECITVKCSMHCVTVLELVSDENLNDAYYIPVYNMDMLLYYLNESPNLEFNRFIGYLDVSGYSVDMLSDVSIIQEYWIYADEEYSDDKIKKIYTSMFISKKQFVVGR